MEICKSITSNQSNILKEKIKNETIIDEIVKMNPKVFSGCIKNDGNYLLLIKDFIDEDDEEINCICIKFYFRNDKIIGTNGNISLFEIDEDWQQYKIERICVKIFDNSFSLKIQFVEGEYTKIIKDLIINAFEICFSSINS